MKKIKIIFKILFILALILLNSVFIIYNYYYSDYELLNVSIENTYNMVSATDTHIEKDNKMSLIYFYTEDTLEQERFNTIKSFIENTDCSKVVNFVEYKIDVNNLEDYIIYNSMTGESGSNSIVLLNKLGHKTKVFSSETSVINIENELKDILKNYL